MIEGKIYMIRSFQTNDVYIGSTTQQLCKRMSCHRRDYVNYLSNDKKYISSFEVLKYEDAYIELIKNVSCDTKEELKKEEGICIRETPNCVNKNKAGRNKKQYREDHKEQIAEKARQYYQNNKELVAERRKKWKEENKEKVKLSKKKWSLTRVVCDCGGTFIKRHKARHFRSNIHTNFINSSQ